ncbi:MAG: hypothetical protein L0211_13090 [Planctomycetaceae bacterium]|nr:hypothetical protein [Planctomycetaceae bacterium]
MITTVSIVPSLSAPRGRSALKDQDGVFGQVQVLDFAIEFERLILPLQKQPVLIGLSWLNAELCKRSLENWPKRLMHVRSKLLRLTVENHPKLDKYLADGTSTHWGTPFRKKGEKSGESGGRQRLRNRIKLHIELVMCPRTTGPRLVYVFDNIIIT